MRELNPRAWSIDSECWCTRVDYDGYKEEWSGIVPVLAPDNRSKRIGEVEDTNIIVEFPTGIKDKNGNEICMGDILKFRGRFYEVVFDDYGQFCLDNKKYHWLENRYSFNSVNIWNGDETLVEIVGNIHEQPELLEAKNEPSGY